MHADVCPYNRALLNMQQEHHLQQTEMLHLSFGEHKR